MAEDNRTKIGATGPVLAQRGTGAPAGTPAPVAPTSTPTPSASPSSSHPTSYLPPAVDPLIGQTLAGRYSIQKKLGEGGMGAVYLATHNLLDKQVALKILHNEFSRKQDLVERFMQEAKSASRIRHENVIDISDFGSTPEGLVFFAMELLKGHDLHEEVARARLAGELLPWSRSKKIFLQICSALIAAHAQGIVHRDLKPENVYLIEFLGEPDFVKLLDFGIAKLTEVDEGGRKLTKTGMLFGTPEYMSPEQARGENVDHRVDVYAMGCILFQLVTGRVPFEADNFMGVLSLHLTEPPPSIPVEVFDRIGAPRALAGVIDKALLKDRNQRWNTILELANAVRQVSGDPISSGMTGLAIPIQAPRVAAPATTTSSRQRTQWTGNVQVPTDEDGPGKGRSRLPLILGGVLLAGAAAAAAVFALKGKDEGGTTTGSADGSGSAGSGSAIVATGSAGSGSAAGTGAGSQLTVNVPPDAPPPEDLTPVPAKVTIRLISKPKGADVTDMALNFKLGQKTPVSFSMNGVRSVRSFLVHKDGYIDTIVELVPDKNLEYIVDLEKGDSAAPAVRKIVPRDKPSVGSGSAADPVTKPDTTKPDTTKPDTTKPDTTKPDTTKPDTTKPDTTKPDTTKPPEDCPDPPCEVLKQMPFDPNAGK